MYQILPRFVTAAVALLVILGLVQLLYYFRFKHKASVTDVDKQLWQLRLFSGFLGVLLLMATVYLPARFPYSDIKLPAESEAVLQTLIQNQRRIARDFDALLDVLNFVLAC